MRLDLQGNSYGGSTRIFKNGVDLQVGVTAGNPQVWDSKPLFQTCTTTCTLSTFPLREVNGYGQSHLFASAGVDFWAAQYDGAGPAAGYRDSRGLHQPSWAVVACDNASARAAVVVDGGLCVWDGQTLSDIEPTGADYWREGDIHFSRGVLGWRKHGVLKVAGKAQPVQIPASGVRFDGDYLIAWQDGRGLVMHTWESPHGIVLSPVANFNADIRDLGNGHVIVVAGQNGGDEGEFRYDIDWPTKIITHNGEARVADIVDLSKLALEVQVITHPFLLCVYKDPEGVSGAPAEIAVNHLPPAPGRDYFVGDEDCLNGADLKRLLGFYGEGAHPEATLALAQKHHTRALLNHDAQGDFTLPAGMRPYDIPMLECYRYANETLAGAQARWLRQAQQLLLDWKGDCGITLPFYTMGYPVDLWTPAEVLSIIHAGFAVINLSPRFKVVACFAYQRLNGINTHPEFQAALAELHAQAGSVTLMSVTAIPPPVPTPAPVPVPIPIPQPIPVFPIAKTKVFMFGYLSVNRKFLGCDPSPVRSVSGDGQFPVYVNRPAGGAWEEIEFIPRDALTFRLRLVASNRILSMTPDGTFETRPLTADGGWEAFYCTEQPDGSIHAYRRESGGTIPKVADITVKKA